MSSLTLTRRNARCQVALLTSLLLGLLQLPAVGEFKVGLVLDRGGKDDKSFNSSA